LRRDERRGLLAAQPHGTAMTEPLEHRIRLHTGLHAACLEWNAAHRGEWPTVLLIHGFLDAAAGWLPLIGAGLAGGLHIIAPDLRGHGDSDWVDRGGYYHFVDYLADLDALVEALALQRFHLVGHSLGGSIACGYAAVRPELVERLVVMEGLGPPEDPTPMPDRVRRWLDRLRASGRPQARSYPDLETAAERIRRHDPLLDAALARELARATTRQLDDGRLCFKHDPLHLTPNPYPFRVEVSGLFWQRITCPVLHLEGGASPFAAASAELERRHAFFRDSLRQRIEGAGHMMQRHRPAEVCRHIRQFLLA
jgi:pimeloyl-ACP methyl ester carboxylesterase